MSSHTNKDEAAGAPLWSVAAIRKEPTSANRTDLFNDTTANNFITKSYKAAELLMLKN